MRGSESKRRACRVSAAQHGPARITTGKRGRPSRNRANASKDVPADAFLEVGARDEPAVVALLPAEVAHDCRKGTRKEGSNRLNSGHEQTHHAIGRADSSNQATPSPHRHQ